MKAIRKSSVVAISVLLLGVTFVVPIGAANKRGVVKKKPATSKAAKAQRTVGKKAVHRKPKGKLVKTFKVDSAIWLVRQAFHCAVDFDEPSGFGCYTKLVVEDRRDSPRARKNLRRYQWAHFRKWAGDYIEPGKVFALRESRRVPAKLTGKTAIVKIFLVSRNRDNPAPIELKRVGGVWRVYSNSL
jgi:hypothetical protein